MIRCSKRLLQLGYIQVDKALLQIIRSIIPKKRSLSQRLLLIFLLTYNLVFSQEADFKVPDTVCVNTPINITNLSPGASSYYWNFCAGSLGRMPLGTNFSSANMSWPAYMDLVDDGNTKFCFVSNHQIAGNGSPGGLSRLDFGNDYNNNPIITQLGSLGGVLPFQTDGIAIQKQGNEWVGFIVGGYNPPSPSKLIRLNFGNSLQNTPIATNLGNLGNMTFPHDLQLIEENGTWYGFTVNTGSNTITKFVFGTSLNNIPTALNIGNIGNLNYPLGIFLFKDSENWHFFISNQGVMPGSKNITRLDFGNSINNLPTAHNLSIPNTTSPTDITIIRDCGSIFGFVTNQNNTITSLEFGSSILNTPQSKNLGNIGTLNYPHSISEIYRTGATLHFFVPNILSKSVTRYSFMNCNTSTIPSSNLPDPPTFSFSNPGAYNISLVIDDGLPTQNTICKSITVVDKLNPSLGNDIRSCFAQTITLGETLPLGFVYLWSTGNTSRTIQVANTGNYWVEVSNGGCTKRDSIQIELNAATRIEITDTICDGESILGYSKSGIYTDTFQTFDGCDSIRTLLLSVRPLPKPQLGPDRIMCKGENEMLNPGIFERYLWQDGSTLSTLKVSDIGLYSLLVWNGPCKGADTMQVIALNDVPKNFLIDAPKLCYGENISVPGYIRYLWSTGETTPEITIKKFGTITLIVTDKYGCVGKDTTNIQDKHCPLVQIPNAFTPNGDGINDIFRPIFGLPIKEYRFQLFNRWGQHIVMTYSPQQGWDGRWNGENAPSGIFYYVLGFKDVDGKDQQKSGSVVLIR